MKEATDEDDAEENVLEKTIRKFRLVKKELFELTRPIDEVLKRITQHEQECVDKLHRLKTEKHDGQKQQQTVPRLIEVESELTRVKSELTRVKSENVKLSDTINKQKLSLEQGAKDSKAQRQKTAELATRLTVTERELHVAKSALQARSETDDSGTVGELEKQLSETRELLNKTTEELSGTRQRLSDVQERLTVAEQVTAATQQRARQELQESSNSEEQQLELTPQHQLTKHAGEVLIY